jgi:hypothetical protein
MLWKPGVPAYNVWPTEITTIKDLDGNGCDELMTGISAVEVGG